jgi:hypothetical protein
MRRLAFAAAVCGTLVLAACNDQTPTEPAVPPRSENFGSCGATPFPLAGANGIAAQIANIYPGTSKAQTLLRATALAQAAAIKLFWDTCHPDAARKVAFAFIDWLNRHTPAGKETQVQNLILAVLRGIGEVTGAPADGDFGVGFFDPANPNNTVITTVNHHALIELEPGSFLVPTEIVISRKAGDPDLTDAGGRRQFPPTYDYNAINSTNTHVLEIDPNTGERHLAIVAFCLVFLDDVAFPGGYPANLAMGHNPVAGAPNFPFEILDPVNLVAEGLRDDLHCPEGTLPDPGLTSSGGGFLDLANAAFRTAGSLLLPPPLWATALGTLPPPPPLSGKAPSLTPFKPVGRTVTTSTSLTSSSSLAIVGEPLTLTATVSPAPPTTQEPSVEFFDGTTSLGFGSLNSNGVATSVTSSLSLVPHSLTAKFPGTSTLAASTSSALVQNMVERFDASTFADAVGGADPYSTQNFNDLADGATISTIIDGVLTVTSPFDQLLVSGAEKFLFGSDIGGNPTRTAGDGKYDLAFAPLTNNALAFDVMAENPSAGPATVVVSVGAASASFLAPNTSGNETTPVFFGIIASAPFSSVEVIEGPETPTIISEEIGLDNFQVGTVSLPLSF